MTITNWVEPFTFSESDRTKLRKPLGSKKFNHTDCEKFIDDAQSIVETWRKSIQMVDQRLGNKERQDAAARIKHEAEQLAERLRELPEFNSGQLDARLYETNKDRFNAPGRNVAIVQDVLSDLAHAASNLPLEPRNRKHAQMVQMIRALASAYRQHFECDPGKSRNTAFGTIVTICLRRAGFGTTDPQYLMGRARKV